MAHIEVKKRQIDLQNLDKAALVKLDQPKSGEVNEAAIEAEIEAAETYATKIVRVTVILERELLKRTEKAKKAAVATQKQTKFKSPAAPFVKYEESTGALGLVKWFSEFEEIAAKFVLSDFEKFTLLKENITGEPLNLVNTINFQDRSFAAAKELLLTAFAQKGALKTEAVRKLLGLKPTKNYHHYAAEMRNIREVFSANEIKLEDVFEHIFLDSMNGVLKRNLVKITNTNHPTLQQIEEKIFEAIERADRPPKTERLQPNPQPNQQPKTVPPAVKPYQSAYKPQPYQKYPTPYKPLAVSSRNQPKSPAVLLPAAKNWLPAV